MGLETATYINQLDGLWPLGGDSISKGDDHIRLIKNVLQSTFPNANAAVNPTPTELNLLVGLLASAAELNIMNGALLSTAELNILNGVTATTTNINRLTSIAGNGALDAFPTGTLMTFQQTAAPTGWTKQTTHNDKALRVVTGTVGNGGSSSFTTVFGKTATDGHQLTLSQTPAHQHAGYAGPSFERGGSRKAAVIPGYTSNNASAVDTTSDAPSNKFTQSEGSDGSHAHNMDIRVQYVDIIIASKNA